MVYAVQAHVGFRNTARRDTVMGNVQTRLQQNVPWGTTTVAASNLRAAGDGDPAMDVDVWFTTKAEQQAFWTDLIAAFGSGVNGPTTGSYAYMHDCLHDTPNPPPCVINQRVDF